MPQHEPAAEPEPTIAEATTLAPEQVSDREPVGIPVGPWPADDTASSWDAASDVEPGPAAAAADEIAAAATGAPPAVEVPEGAAIQAAIDVGSTSVHLLVAAIDAHRVIPLLDESAFLGLGDRVARDGRLGAGGPR